MDAIVGWIQNNWFELIAALLGLIGIFLQIRQNTWYWLTSIIMVLLYIVVFFQSRFYADMSFQLYYLAVSIYGWYYWVKNKGKSDRAEITTSSLTKRQWLYCIICSVVFFFIIYFILTNFTNSDVAFGDAFTTSLSIVATLLLARKILENWLFWIVVDAVSTGLYIYKGLYPTVVLFTALTALAVYGYFKWKKAFANTNKDIC